MLNNLNGVTVMCMLGIVICSSAWARECNDTSRVQRFAEQEGRRIAKYYDGGRNLRVRVMNCDFDENRDRYTINMHTYWDGVLSNKVYNVDGILKIDLDGSNPHYKETYSNQNLKDWVGLKTGLSVLDAIMKNSSDYSR